MSSLARRPLLGAWSDLDKYMILADKIDILAETGHGRSRSTTRICTAQVTETLFGILTNEH